MQELAEMFRAGGIWMYLILVTAAPAYLLAVSSIVLAIPAAASGKLRKPLIICAALTVMSAAIMVVLGYAGYQTGLAEMQAALEHVSPDKRQAMVTRGREIAVYPMTFASWLAPLPGLAGVLGIIAYAFSSTKAEQD